MKKPSLRIQSLLGIVLLMTCLESYTSEQLPDPDHVVPAWYLGMPVVIRSFELGAGFMEEDKIPQTLPYPEMISYIIGIADLAIGASPHQRIKLPDGQPVTMPGHQAVLSCLNSPSRPRLGIAYSVVPGPNAKPTNLKADPMPQTSVIGAPLATAIRIGPSWLPLTNHKIIEYGMLKGILRLRFFGANPVIWATPEWDNNYPYLPAMNEPCEAASRPDPKFVLSQHTIIPQH